MKLSRHRLRPTAAMAVLPALGALGVVTAVSAHAAAGCQVTYTVSSQWSGGFGANVSVTNLGDPVSIWTLTWSFGAGQQITQAWNATITQNGANVTAKNASYNGSLATNANTSFGFNGSWTGSNPIPTNFALNGVPCTGDTSGGTPTPTPTPTDTPIPTPTPTPTGPWPPSASYANPVLWEDFADPDVFRVGDTFYYSASSMHYSPGAPILRSYDLVNWEVAGHSVPSLDFGSKYDLNGGRGYARGVWASYLNYRKSNKTFYWGGCIDFSKTYIYTAAAVEGPWSRRSTINNCYYDAGLLIDDDDTMYVSYGNPNISVAQLSADGLSQVKTQQVFTTPSNVGTVEGSRFYKINGAYYILVTHPADAEYVLKSTSGPFGPYTMRPLVNQITSPVSGSGFPHQGGLVQLQNGQWYYMAFVDSYPGGRIPVLAPVTWTSDGWPQVQTGSNGGWAISYPYPNVPAPAHQVRPPTGSDTFSSSTLGPEWEWNHNPDNTKWSAGNGLRLQTATVTNDLYSARNTLTHRILGPTSTATIELDYSQMKDGDRAGLALLRDSSGWIGVQRDNGATKLVREDGITMDTNWNTTGTGTPVASTPISGGHVWLRVSADIHPGAGRQGHFSYSTDGTNFTSFGPAFTMDNSWQFFMGYRYAIFNYATQSLGGAVTVPRFDLTTP